MLTLLQDSFLQRLADLLRLSPADVAHSLVQVVVIWAMAWVALRLIHLIARRIIQAVDDGDDSTLTAAEKRGQTIAQLLRSVGRVVVSSIAILLTLDVFFDIGPLLAGAGILGLAVSFGAQSLVKDVISGFFILLENQFVVGDVIEAGGKSGAVERMTLRVVMLRDLHGVLHVIPNGQINSVSNYTRGWSRAVVEVVVPFDVDVDRALAVFGDEARRFGADPAWAPMLDGPAEVTGVETLTDTGVMIRTLLRTHPGQQWAVGREFRRRMLVRLEQEGIERPHAVRLLHLRPEGTAATSGATK